MPRGKAAREFGRTAEPIGPPSIMSKISPIHLRFPAILLGKQGNFRHVQRLFHWNKHHGPRESDRPRPDDQPRATRYVFTGVSFPSLTITAGGIAANEDVAINVPCHTIGARKRGPSAAGKNLTIGGDLHTIISPLTLNGDGNTTITGSIDGGGVLNTLVEGGARSRKTAPESSASPGRQPIASRSACPRARSVSRKPPPKRPPATELSAAAAPSRNPVRPLAPRRGEHLWRWQGL